MGFDINGLGVCCGVTETLHHQIGGKSQTGEFLEFVPGHRASGILGTYGGHQRFAGCPWTYTRQPAGFSDHFLGEGKAFSGLIPP